MPETKFSDGQRLSHAYIVVSPGEETALAAAKRIAAAAVCSGGGEVPCGVCRNCRKAEADIHPDIVTVSRLTDEKGKTKREISVDQIREVIRDAVVLPNEAERKVYIIREAELMNVQAQNAALKLLEEPPRSVILILTVTGTEKLLPTVRSRCAEIICRGEERTADEETVKLAKGYLKAVASSDEAKVLSWCSANEGMDNRGAQEFMRCTSALLADMLCGRAPTQGMSRKQLLKLAELTDRCAEYLRVNTGCKHIFGLLAADCGLGAETEEK